MSPYWLGIFPVSCNLRFGWLFVSLCFQGVFSLVSIVVQIKLYVFVRRCIHYLPSTNMELVVKHMYTPSNSGCLHRYDATVSRISHLEMQVARILCVGILPFCLLTLFLCFITLALLVFRYQGVDASWINPVMEVFREFLIALLIYIPAVFVIQSREFKAAGRRFCRFRPPNLAAQFG